MGSACASGILAVSSRWSKEQRGNPAPLSYIVDIVRLLAAKFFLRPMLWLEHCLECAGLPYGQEWAQGDVIGCAIDLDAATISFSRNGADLGIAFQNIRRLAYFPAASLSYGGFECNRKIKQMFAICQVHRNAGHWTACMWKNDQHASPL